MPDNNNHNKIRPPCSPSAVDKPRRAFQCLSFIAVLAVCLVLSGCAGLATQRLVSSVTSGLLNQEDPATAAQGMPAYLLMIDGLLVDHPDDNDLLVAGARLYSAYAGVFADDQARALSMSDKALRYSRRAFCDEFVKLCLAEKDFARFSDLLAEIDRDGLPILYTYAAAWAGWIQLRSDNWLAVADLPKVEVMMRRAVALDETYDHGQAHLYLGVIHSQLSPALGGRPEIGRRHFERAMELSRGRNLIVQVEYARHYARLMFDRALHDKLLNDVLNADTKEAGLTLSNVIAQRQARELLEESSEYFEE